MKLYPLPRCKVNPWEGVRPKKSLWQRIIFGVFINLFVILIPCLLCLSVVIVQWQDAEMRDAKGRVRQLEEQVAEHETFNPNRACLSWWFGSGTALRDARVRLCGK